MGAQTRLLIHLGETLPARLAAEQREIRWGTLLLLVGVLFSCSLISFGIGAPTGVSLQNVPCSTTGAFEG